MKGIVAIREYVENSTEGVKGPEILNIEKGGKGEAEQERLRVV